MSPPPFAPDGAAARPSAPLADPEPALSSALARAALAQLAEGVIVADASGRIVFVNEAAAGLHGVARLDVAPDAYAAAYHLLTEDGRPYPSEELPLARAAVRGEAVADARWRIRRPDGSEVLAVGGAAPVRDADGRQVGAVLTLRDDTAREAAAVAERRAARLLDRMADAHMVLDREFRIVAVNPAAERALGAPRAALLGRTHWEAFPASVDSDAGRAYRRVAAEGVEQHVQQHYVGEGYDRRLEIDAYPTDDGGIAILWRDLTETARARTALEVVANNATLALFIMDERQQCTYMNPAAERLTGFTLAELHGKALHYHVHHTRPDGTPYPLEECPIDRAFPQNMREQGEEVFVHRDGHFYPVAFTASPIRDGGRTLGTVIEVRDIGEEKAREHERERLVADVRATNDALRRVNADARAAEARARFLADLGAALQPIPDPDELVAAAARRLGEHLGADRCAYAEVEADEDHFTITGNYTRGDTISIVGRFSFRAFGAEVLRLMRANREYVVDDAEADPRVSADDRDAYARTQIRSVICVPLHKGGRLAAAMAVHQRVPRRWTPEEIALATTVVQRCWESLERARAMRALRASEAELTERTAAAEEARREAAAANQAKSAFLATMSHELRTPINAITGYAQLLDLGIAGPLTDEQRGYLDRLAASSQHLLGLVNDVLDLSKIEAGETRVAQDEATTGAAVRAALDLATPMALAKGVRVVEDRADDDAGAPYVGDEDRVRQIVLNLLSNAVKFTPAGGVVTVGYDTVADTPGRARLHGAGPWSCVRVQDTGVGIAPEEQGRIFAPFHQVEGGHTRRAGGTGLGLTISRQLARLMGGDLTVESAAGEGSTFTLWLPAARRAAARPGVGGDAETAAARAARAAPAGRILDAPELAEIGAVLRDVVHDVLAAYADRLRADPHTPWARTMRRPEIEDHQVSLLGDLAQSLVIVGAAGPEAEVLLADGSAIQRTIALHHGARRHAQGWSEPGMRRDYQVLREEVARAVRGRLGAERPGLDDALRVVTGLIDRAEAVSVGAWRRAAAVEG